MEALLRRVLETARELTGARYALVCERVNEDPFAPELFPGLSIPLGELWSA